MTFGELETMISEQREQLLSEYKPFDYLSVMKDSPLANDHVRLMIQAWTDCMGVIHKHKDDKSDWFLRRDHMCEDLDFILEIMKAGYKGSSLYDLIQDYYEPIIRYEKILIWTKVKEEQKEQNEEGSF